MNFSRPLQVVTPTLDGDVLAVLARADAELTGRGIHRLVGHSSEAGVRKAADRLARQGIIGRRGVGRSYLYRLNREHVAAPWIEGLATLRPQLIDRLRAEVQAWTEQPTVAFVFGSFARGEATVESDLDVLVVRPARLTAESTAWDRQIAELQHRGTQWTGNDTRVLQFGEEELSGEPVLERVLEEGVELYGTRGTLRKLLRSSP
jgi:predicted nucleotidyltransferase